MAQSHRSRAPAMGRPESRSKPELKSSVLAPLHAAEIVSSKPFLPAELIALVLDYLPVPELLRFARTAKKYQEMVYDDTRWVQKLQVLGLWNESEARQRMEEALKRRLESQNAREADEARRTGAHLSGSINGIAGGGDAGLRKPGDTLFDANWEDESEAKMFETNIRRKMNGIQRRGESVSTSSGRYGGSFSQGDSLGILQRFRSIRGHARQEYGRIYGALAPYYYDLVGDRDGEALLFRAFQDPEDQARMLAQIQVFARGDELEGWRSREETLESLTSAFENAVLQEFENALATRDFDGQLRRYAHVLVALNGGSAGMDVYIHSHKLLIDKDHFGDLLACLDGSTADHVSLRPSQEYFQRLLTVLNEEIFIMDRVFPPSVDIFIPFLERLVEEVVNEQITLLFDEAHEKGLEIYLKLVAGVFEQTRAVLSSLGIPKGSSKNFQIRASAALNRCFEPHIDLYLQEELDFFNRKGNSLVDSWEKQLSEQEATTESFFMSNVNRQAEKRDFLTSFKKVVMMPVNVLPTFPLTVPFGTSKPTASSLAASSRLPTPAAATPERSASPHPQAPSTELAAQAAIMNSKLEGISGLFSIELALNLVHACKASLERAALFVQLGGQSGEEAKEQCTAMFVQLLYVLGFRHIKSGFDRAVSHLSSYSAREALTHGSAAGVKPLVTFLELVNVGDLITQMVDVFYVQELVGPRLSDRDDFLDAGVKEKKRFEQMLDERVAAGLNRGIDVLMDEVEFICATTQAATDFNPASTAEDAFSAAMLDIGPTKTAVQVVDLVSSHTGMLVGSTDKNMLDVFNQEVGLRLFASLCKHFKQRRVSVDGAIKLIADTNHYYAYIATLRNKELLLYFRALREVGQIFLVDGRHAKEIATIVADADRYGGIFRVEEVLEFAERRADWFAIKANVERAMFGLGCTVM